MKKLMCLVGLMGFFLMVNITQAATINVSYCVYPVLSDTIYRVTQDIWFDNASSYNYNCFNNPAGANNVTIDFQGHTLYPNDTTTAGGVLATGAGDWTIRNGTIDFTHHGTTSSNCILFSSATMENLWIENLTCDGASGIGYTGLISLPGHTNLTVRDSSFTGFGRVDTDLKLPQSEVHGCGNEYSTTTGGTFLSKDACTAPPAEYRDYTVLINCTAHSSTSYGSLSCSNNIPIPADCINITTEAWTVITMQNETNLNSSHSFSRYTCNPEGDRVTYCDNRYKTCNYGDMNSYPSVLWDSYAAGGNATSYHIAVLPQYCMESTGGNFSMIGRLYMACKSYTESGVHIDEVEYNCSHEVRCYNSNTMEERFPDCTSILTPCPYGCVEGVCMPYEEPAYDAGSIESPMFDMPFAAGAWVAMLFSPFALITMFLIGIGAYFENQVKSHGAIFLLVVIVGVLGFTYIGLYPAWIGILIIIFAGAIFVWFFRSILTK